MNSKEEGEDIIGEVILKPEEGQEDEGTRELWVS
jgi:hypothetical protein